MWSAHIEQRMGLNRRHPLRTGRLIVTVSISPGLITRSLELFGRIAGFGLQARGLDTRFTDGRQL